MDYAKITKQAAKVPTYLGGGKVSLIFHSDRMSNNHVFEVGFDSKARLVFQCIRGFSFLHSYIDTCFKKGKCSHLHEHSLSPFANLRTMDMMLSNTEGGFSITNLLHRERMLFSTL